jgi:hypothetical protein
MVMLNFDVQKAYDFSRFNADYVCRFAMLSSVPAPASDNTRKLHSSCIVRNSTNEPAINLLIDINYIECSSLNPIKIADSCC